MKICKKCLTTSNDFKNDRSFYQHDKDCKQLDDDNSFDDDASKAKEIEQNKIRDLLEKNEATSTELDKKIEKLSHKENVLRNCRDRHAAQIAGNHQPS